MYVSIRIFRPPLHPPFVYVDMFMYECLYTGFAYVRIWLKIHLIICVLTTAPVHMHRQSYISLRFFFPKLFKFYKPLFVDVSVSLIPFYFCSFIH